MASLASSVAVETVAATMEALQARPPPPPPPDALTNRTSCSSQGPPPSVMMNKESLARVATCLDRATKATEKAMMISLQASNAFKEEMDRLTEVKRRWLGSCVDPVRETHEKKQKEKEIARVLRIKTRESMKRKKEKELVRANMKRKKEKELVRALRIKTRESMLSLARDVWDALRPLRGYLAINMLTDHCAA